MSQVEKYLQEGRKGQRTLNYFIFSFFVVDEYKKSLQAM